MEDTLRAPHAIALNDGAVVLILVLMEDTLREGIDYIKVVRTPVLILVLMEDTLRVYELLTEEADMNRLNPCFNGRYSQR